VRRPAYGWETAGAIIIMENMPNVPLWISAMAAGLAALALIGGLCWMSAESDKKAGDK
jgi:hypothetical protein